MRRQVESVDFPRAGSLGTRPHSCSFDFKGKVRRCRTVGLHRSGGDSASTSLWRGNYLTCGSTAAPLCHRTLQTYGSAAFALLRDLNGITLDAYREAISRPWIPFSTNSKSGQLFFRSDDGTGTTGVYLSDTS